MKPKEMMPLSPAAPEVLKWAMSGTGERRSTIRSGRKIFPVKIANEFLSLRKQTVRRNGTRCNDCREHERGALQPVQSFKHLSVSLWCASGIASRDTRLYERLRRDESPRRTECDLRGVPRSRGEWTISREGVQCSRHMPSKESGACSPKALRRFYEFLLYSGHGGNHLYHRTEGWTHSLQRQWQRQ